MTSILVTLAFPLATPNGNNALICAVVEELDGCNCIVIRLSFKPCYFSLIRDPEIGLEVVAKTDCPLDNADRDEKEAWLQKQFDLHPRLPDCSIVEIK